MLTTQQERRTGVFPLLHDGLVTCIPFDTGDRAPRDLVSGARPSTWSTPTIVRDQWGVAAVRFNGSSDKVLYADQAGLDRPSTAITVYTRFNYSGTKVGLGMIPGKAYASGFEYSYGFEIGDLDFLTAYLEISGTLVSIATTLATPAGVWLNFFCRWASGGPVTVDTFYDGAAAVASNATVNKSGALVYNTESLEFGTQGQQAGFVGGDLSMFALWNRRLTDGELSLIASDRFLLARRTATPARLPVAAPAWVGAMQLKPMERYR